MPRPASDYAICPSCGTEFGVDDFEYTPEELRARWIANGKTWSSRAVLRPFNWNADEQLKELDSSIPSIGVHYADAIIASDNIVFPIAKSSFDFPGRLFQVNSFFASKPNFVLVTVQE